MKIKDGFKLRQVCGENVIMAEGLSTVDFGKLVSLNGTAAFLWKEATNQGEFSPESLSEALCNEYEVDAQKALADTQAMVERWISEGLVEK